MGKAQEQILLESIKKRSYSALKSVYLQNKDGFARYLSANFKISDEQILDVYHEAFYIFYKNTINGKLQKLDSTILSYLNGIGKNLIRTESRERQKLMSTDNLSDDMISLSESGNPDPELYNNMVDKAMELYKEMRDPCRSILEKYYFENMSLNDIKESMGYAGNNTVRVQKSRCIKKLRDALVRHFNL